MDRENAHSNHIGAIHRTAFKNDQAALHEAENAAAASKSITMRETWHSYKKAILWSMVLSTALIMEGFDVVIVSVNGSASDLRSTASLVKMHS